MKKFAATFQIVIGAGIIGIWIFLWGSNQIPELETEPVRILMHITAEIVTGLLLLVSGVWIILKKYTHNMLFNLSFGCLIYSLLASPGYYAQKGEWIPFIIFMMMLVITIGLLFLNSKRGMDKNLSVPE